MAHMRFNREYTHKVDANTRKTFPNGWLGEPHPSIAHAARKAGAAEFVGEDAAAAEEEFKKQLAAEEEAAKAIPEDWKSLNAAGTVELARKLGAGEDVTTKAAAVDFIEGHIATQEPKLV